MEATTLLYVIIIHEFSFCCGTIKVLYLEKNLVFFESGSLLGDTWHAPRGTWSTLGGTLGPLGGTKQAQEGH